MNISFLYQVLERIKYLEENVEAYNINLTKEEDDQVRKVVNELGVKGERYPLDALKFVNL